MSYKIDFQTDYSGKELYQYLNGAELPDFVKEAELPDAETVSNLPKTAFAEPLHKWFPINNKVNTFISNAYFTHKAAALQEKFGNNFVQEIAGNIKKAATLFGIQKSLRDFNKQAEAKSNTDYEEFSITAKIAETEEVELYRIKTAAEALAAANHFTKYVANYPFTWRRKIATDLVDLANKFQLEEIPDLVCKYAGMFFPDGEKMQEVLYSRATKLASADNVLIMCELAKTAKDIDDIEQVFKIAETCDTIEKSEGLSLKVAQLLGDPVDKLFTIDFNKVASIIDVVKLGDESYYRSDLESVPSDIYHRAFGIEDLDPKSAEWSEICPTLPRSDIALFKELSGIKPV